MQIQKESAKTFKRMFSKRFILGSMVVLTCSLIIAFWCYNTSKFVPMPTIHIGEEGISKEEYTQAVQDNRHKAVNYFKEEGNVTLNKDWNTKIQGKVPIEVLSEYALQHLSHRVAIYQLAKQDGIIDNASYESMFARMEKENQIRKKKQTTGNIVYGLSQFTMKSYETYEKNAFKKYFCQSHSVDEATYVKTVQEAKEKIRIKVNKKQLYAFTLDILNG